jgi:hypothetical protein
VQKQFNWVNKGAPVRSAGLSRQFHGACPGNSTGTYGVNKDAKILKKFIFVFLCGLCAFACPVKFTIVRSAAYLTGACNNVLLNN